MQKVYMNTSDGACRQGWWDGLVGGRAALYRDFSRRWQLACAFLDADGIMLLCPQKVTRIACRGRWTSTT
jgi:hypothetical protein